jgi:hypothetical protein
MPRAATPSVVSMSLHDDKELGALHRELEGRGARVVTPHFEVIWQKGIYEFDVEDLDGNVLIFWGGKPK